MRNWREEREGIERREEGGGRREERKQNFSEL
jgi:hypothetical protein